MDNDSRDDHGSSIMKQDKEDDEPAMAVDNTQRYASLHQSFLATMKMNLRILVSMVLLMDQVLNTTQ